VKTYFRPERQVSIKGFGRPGAFDAEKATKKQWSACRSFLRSSFKLESAGFASDSVQILIGAK
jgi:hypothetical protein